MKSFWLIALIFLVSCQRASDISTTVEDTPQSDVEQTMVRSTAPNNAMAYIIEPEDGAVIPSGTVTVKFGLSGMGVAPAGIDFPNSGHHHLLVNAMDLPAMDMPIPTDSSHLHFGLGQTETSLELSSGSYTLQLVLGDFAHIPHDPPVVSDPVIITVE
ncbi:MAG: DUF4399 domain-containing protein [Bacteroidetes bacterium]|nr:DUF4399 domain-containing protein [Bacteroidota bacterium]